MSLHRVQREFAVHAATVPGRIPEWELTRPMPAGESEKCEAAWARHVAELRAERERTGQPMPPDGDLLRMRTVYRLAWLDCYRDGLEVRAAEAREEMDG